MFRKILPFCFFIFVGLTALWAQQSKYYQASTIPLSLKKEANAVIRFSEMKIELESQNLMNVKGKRIVAVLNKLGNNDLGVYLYYDDNVKIKNIKAVIFDAFGNEIKTIKQKHFKDVSAVSGGTLYSDSRVLYLEYTPVSFPFTVAYEYEYETSNTAFIPTWSPLEGFRVSTELSTIAITDPTGLGLRAKEKNFPDFPGIENQSTEETITYTAKNLQAVEYEEFSPSLRSYKPQVLFAISKLHLEGVDGEVYNWADMGKWQYDNLLVGTDELPEDTVNKMKALTADLKDPLEKAKVVYQYMQENTRYISVQVGIGGWRPIKAEIVDEVKYGDCKGLTNYTRALLKAVGVKSYYAVVYAGSDKRGMEENFASMQGNHVILNIPSDNGDVWLECTSQIHPFGFLGDFTDNRDVLVVTDEGGVIKRTHAYKDDSNHQQINAEYKLDETGSISGEVLIKTSGIQYDQHFVINDYSKDEIEEHYKSYWSNINNLNIESFNLENEKSNIKFIEKIQISATKYASLAGERMIFAPNAFNKLSNIPNRYRNRKMPLEIDRGFFDEDEFSVHLPEGYEIEAMAESKSIENEFGIYKVDLIKNGDNSIKLKRSLIIHEGKYSKEKYAAFREFLMNINKHDNAKIVLIKS